MANITLLIASCFLFCSAYSIPCPPGVGYAGQVGGLYPGGGIGIGRLNGGGYFPGLNIPGINVPGVNFPGVNVPGVSIPGVSVPGVNFPGFNLGGLNVPGGIISKPLPYC